jgi:hypothetical protein
MANADVPRSKRLSNAACSYIIEAVMPVETLVSFPVPLRRDSQLVAAFFAAVAKPLADGSNAEVFKPSALVYVDWETEAVLEHEMVSGIPFADEDQPVALANPPEFARLSRDEMETRVGEADRELYQVLDDVAPLYDRSDLSEAERQLLSRCNTAYRRVVHPDLWPFYEQINGDFFRWLGGAPESAGSCPQCGATNPSGSRFCGQCGNQLA